jgi:hypothetical protein
MLEWYEEFPYCNHLFGLHMRLLQSAMIAYRVLGEHLESLLAMCLEGLPARYLEGLLARYLEGLLARYLESLLAKCLVVLLQVARQAYLVDVLPKLVSWTSFLPRALCSVDCFDFSEAKPLLVAALPSVLPSALPSVALPSLLGVVGEAVGSSASS